MIQINSCPICDANEIVDWSEVDDFSVSREKFHIYRCLHCTVKFTQNIPSKKDIGAYYQSEQYISHSDSKSGFVNKIYHFVRSFTIRQKVTLVKMISQKKSATLLDLGSGTGTFLLAMKDQGWKVYGMEPDEKAREFSKSKDLQVDDSANLEQLNHSSFDIITLWHVLEHIHDLHESLEILRTSIKEDGFLIIAVPNYFSFDAQFYDKYWAAYDVPRHLYHFTPDSIKTLMSKHHFKVMDIRPMWFDSFYVSMLSEKYKKGSLIRALLIGLISNVKVIFNRSKCSSLIYIVKPLPRA
ncbi:MAG: class I SAM-dependent methyltransferase [Chitinophagaceae bacterium]